MTQANPNNEPIIIENDSDYTALSMAWAIEDTGDVPTGGLKISTMPNIHSGDMSKNMPVLTEADLEELTEPSSNLIGTIKQEIESFNAASLDRCVAASNAPDRKYDGIHDASYLEQMANTKNLQEMDNDGLYVKISVEYAANDTDRMKPQFKATRWDGKVLGSDQLMDGIAHYVSDMNNKGNKMSYEVGEAIMSIDKPVLEAAYGKKGAMQMINDVLVLMTPDFNQKVA